MLNRVITSFFLFFCSISSFAKDIRVIDKNGAARGAENLFRSGVSGVEFPSWVPSDIFEKIWRAWEPDLAEQARHLNNDARKKMAFRRYGLVQNPNVISMPLGFLKNPQGRLTFNCAACHSGEVSGQVVH